MKAGKRARLQPTQIPILEKRVEHIAEPAWADFVRGHSTPEAKSAIKSHLASGCASCSSAAALWQSFMNVAAKEKQFTPPPDTVRLAKAQFAAARGPDQPSVAEPPGQRVRLHPQHERR